MKCVIIDAIPFNGNIIEKSQFKKECVDREVFKSFVGFLPFDTMGISLAGKDEEWFRHWPVSSGKWGCGAFRGNFYLKYIIQTILASLAGRTLIFSCYKNHEALKNEIETFNQKLKDKSIGALYSEVLKQFKYYDFVNDSVPVLKIMF